ncbi:MAG TPA: hypothetical protein QF564_21780 [Pirellulaceae bacterium]|jgi:hypothetical protein|nr:hypothetical protein [Pirellulaceae bacterium]
MSPNRLTFAVHGLLIIAILSSHAAAETNAPEQPRPGISAWDTARASADPLTAEAISARQGWSRIPRNEKVAAFKGDAVISNGRVMAVVRERGSAIDLYTLRPRGAIARARLRLLASKGEPAARLASVALVENTRSAARLQASFRTTDGETIAAKFRLRRGAVTLEIEPHADTGRLRVDCPGRFVVLPDFFADDILIDAHRIPVTRIDVPSEHFLLHLTGKGNAITMCVFENREQDVKVSLAGKGEKRIVNGSEIDFGKGRKIWVALIDAPRDNIPFVSDGRTNLADLPPDPSRTSTS